MNNDAKISILAVTPFNVETMLGGAEHAVREIHSALANDRRFHVQLWQATENPASSERNDGQFGKCFPANNLERKIFGHLWKRTINNLGGSTAQKLGVNGAPYLRGCRRTLQKYGADFDLIYLPHVYYGTSYRLADLWPEKTILHPFVHDEPLFRSRPVKTLLERGRYLLLNSKEEANVLSDNNLVIRGEKFVIGCPVRLSGGRRADDGILHELNLRKNRYILYVGRISSGKRLKTMLDWHRTLQADVPLVIAGSGSDTLTSFINSNASANHRFLGPISERTKGALARNCLAAGMISLMESFSLSVMEAWLGGRPAIIDPGSPCLSGHGRASGASLYASNAHEWREAVLQLLRSDNFAEKLGKNGQTYVLENFRPAVFRKRVGDTFAEIYQKSTSSGTSI